MRVNVVKQQSLSAERLRERVLYDPDTGVMTWRKSYFASRIGKPLGYTSPTTGYRATHMDGRLWPMHRLIWLYVHGRWPADQIDHINGQRADNRLCNLREATHAQNCANIGFWRGRPIKGVTFTRGRWQAQIRVGGKNIYLGLFDTEEEASAAYFAKAREVKGEFMRAA